MEYFSNSDGGIIVYNMIKVIQDNKQYLSDIDGLIGDGDHGINMNKGFTMCRDELDKNSGNLSQNLKVLSRILMADIGGSMGPLYGMFFKALAKGCSEKDSIDAGLFSEMLSAGEKAIKDIGNAEVGDKTLLDCLVPAVDAFRKSLDHGKSFIEALEALKKAAEEGRDSTKDMVAKVGRSSRLGERSRGVLDAGATSCCILLHSMADSIISLIQ